MKHPSRRFRLYSVTNASDLAQQLQQVQKLCTAFLLDEYLFLNDSFRVNAQQRYTIVKLGCELPLELETITFSWYTVPQTIVIINRFLCGEHDRTALGSIELLYLDAPELHHCPLCD
jgi:hypothetical protein